MSDLSFLGALKAAAGRHWDDYVRHPFVTALGRGTLAEGAFRFYLVQDYLFLLHFTRAHAHHSATQTFSGRKGRCCFCAPSTGVLLGVGFKAISVRNCGNIIGKNIT